MISEKVTIIVKTFERPDYLERLIKSIKKYYPTITIMVADDSEQPKIRTDVEYYPLPFDVGVSAGRNFLVSKVKTKYFITVDDDLVFDSKTKLENFLQIIENNDIDLLGGTLTTEAPTRCSDLEIKNNVLTVVPKSLPEDQEFCFCDYVVQWFIADTEKFKSFGGWDVDLKTRGEHIELFLRSKGKLKVAYTDKVRIIHDRGIHGSDKYKKYRNRDHLPIAMKKHKIIKLINHNGIEKNFECE